MKITEIKIPNYELKEKIGSGANGNVYRAIDLSLKRDVAIKIWNARGKQRAQSEISKIAQFQDEHFVSTYFYDEIDGIPYAIMELVNGIDGKKWNAQHNSLDDKIKVWEKYSKALCLLYDRNEFHGDPHLGNLLICYDSNQNISKVKVADTGTSIFWEDHTQFEDRDSELILESAMKIFKNEKIDQFIDLSARYSAYNLLGIISHFIKLLRFLDTEPDGYAYGINSRMFVEILLQMPLFNYSNIKSAVCKIGLTSTNRIAIRINEMFFNREERPLENWEQEFIIEYEKEKQEFLKKYSI